MSFVCSLDFFHFFHFFILFCFLVLFLSSFFFVTRGWVVFKAGTDKQACTETNYSSVLVGLARKHNKIINMEHARAVFWENSVEL